MAIATVCFVKSQVFFRSQKHFRICEWFYTCDSFNKRRARDEWFKSRHTPNQASWEQLRGGEGFRRVCGRTSFHEKQCLRSTIWGTNYLQQILLASYPGHCNVAHRKVFGQARRRGYKLLWLVNVILLSDQWYPLAHIIVLLHILVSVIVWIWERNKHWNYWDKHCSE